MNDVLKEYRIDFTGLTPGVHTFEYHVGQELFDHFGFQDNWTDARIEVKATLTKRPSMMELSIESQGDILVPCDMTGEEFRLPVKGAQHLLIKQGEVPGEQDDVVTIPWEASSVNIVQYIYETIVLGIPQKRYHPDYLSGKMDAPAMQSTEEDTKEEEIDPRWAKLKDIKS